VVRNRRNVNNVRASRDGHEFHEAWTARKALQLIYPSDNLIGITVEGLSEVDQSKAASKTVEIADITLYYGESPNFKDSDTVIIAQFKHSVSKRNKEFRAADAKETITHFATAYRDHLNQFKPNDVHEKLKFELITNRPIYPALEKAVENIATQKSSTKEVKKQADQFIAASCLKGDSLVKFAQKCRIIGFAGGLPVCKRDLSRTLVDWSSTTDPLAQARLGSMRQMVRDKAGSVGTNNNIIRRVDVLGALEIQDEKDLLPCPTSFPNVGEVVKRAQLPDATQLIKILNKPLIIHSAGGVGKTVFLESLASILEESNEIVMFDCFGGGKYRSPEDARHLPKHGFVHIVNTLACRGLCDPLLPSSNDQEQLVRTFRRRLSQCIDTLRRATADRDIVLLIDAIDNAAIHAKEQNQSSFPRILLENVQHSGPIPGVRLVVTCRTERIPISKGDVDCDELPLLPFTQAETELYLRGRLPTVSPGEVQVAHSRSGGNARVLEYLVSSGDGLLDPSEVDKPIILDELLNKRISSALSAAKIRGYDEKDINAFLAGLAVLPPPVPIDEYANALQMQNSAIESFASDMSPLLERTNHGLIFRDEPTETLIKQDYASNNNVLTLVAKNLNERQDSSVYAACSLPGLLQILDDGEKLFNLAFDERLPNSITSSVGKNNIRYARLKAAVLNAAYKKDYNQLVHLLVELSTIAASDRRGADYILDNPDLVIAAKDIDANRRLFETRTNWQGTRHARLAIANTMSCDYDEALRHAIRVDEWICHYHQQDSKQRSDSGGPERLDYAAFPFYLIMQDQADKAVILLRQLKDWYRYEVAQELFSLLEQATLDKPQTEDSLFIFLDCLTNEIGVIAAALSFVEIDRSRQIKLIKKLSISCGKSINIEFNDRPLSDRRHTLQDGLLKASAIAVSIGLTSEALMIASLIPNNRPDIRSYDSPYSSEYLFPFLLRVALISASKGKVIREQDILPRTLANICTNLKITGIGAKYRHSLKIGLDKYSQANLKKSIASEDSISHEEKGYAERYIDEKHESLLSLTRVFAELLGTSVDNADNAFHYLLEVWAKTRNKRHPNSATFAYDPFFQKLGLQIAVFSLWSRSDLKLTSVKEFLKLLHEQEVLNAITVIDVVAILARQSSFHELAGEQAIKARSLIDKEDEVTFRASLYAQLARAIVPASTAEASEYFKAGLEQMDSIGSGDYDFTNELLTLASSLKGDELEEKDFHTLTNICELNMSFDEEKFPWYAFAKGMSKTSGCKGLAKLARWDDRSKISLDFTLLPYLTALIQDDKIAPEDALSLLELSNPVELWNCDTAEFAKSIDNRGYTNKEQIVEELVRQFITKNPGLPRDGTIQSLALLSEKVLGDGSETTSYLSSAFKRFKMVREQNNENMNYRSRSDVNSSFLVNNQEEDCRAKLSNIVNITNPTDEASMSSFVDELN